MAIEKRTIIYVSDALKRGYDGNYTWPIMFSENDLSINDLFQFIVGVYKSEDVIENKLKENKCYSAVEIEWEI